MLPLRKQSARSALSLGADVRRGPVLGLLITSDARTVSQWSLAQWPKRHLRIAKTPSLRSCHRYLEVAQSCLLLFDECKHVIASLLLRRQLSDAHFVVSVLFTYHHVGRASFANMLASGLFISTLFASVQRRRLDVNIRSQSTRLERIDGLLQRLLSLMS